MRESHCVPQAVSLELLCNPFTSTQSAGSRRLDPARPLLSPTPGAFPWLVGRAPRARAVTLFSKQPLPGESTPRLPAGSSPGNARGPRLPPCCPGQTPPGAPLALPQDHGRATYPACLQTHSEPREVPLAEVRREMPPPQSAAAVRRYGTQPQASRSKGTAGPFHQSRPSGLPAPTAVILLTQR